MGREIFGDELTGESGGAIDNDVEFRRRRHLEFPGMPRKDWMGYCWFYFLA
jgi:hypothetical protein